MFAGNENLTIYSFPVAAVSVEFLEPLLNATGIFNDVQLAKFSDGMLLQQKLAVSSKNCLK